MYKKKKIVCLITARSGSKDLKHKNIKKINNLTLIEHSVIAAKKSKYVDEVFISTDSVKYANIAKKKGALVPFIRPKKLALDNVVTIKVINHFLKFLKKYNSKYDYILLLEPTSPMTSNFDIDKAIIDLLGNPYYDSLVGVSYLNKFDLKSIFILNKNKKIRNIENKIYNNFNRLKNRKFYFLDGSIYLSKISKIILNQGFISKKTKGMIFPYHKSFEIDNEVDYKIIKEIFKK